MGWFRETTERWLRILTITGDRSLSMEERPRLISKVNGPIDLNPRLRPYRFAWQRAVAAEALDASTIAARTTLNQYLQASLLTTGLLIGRLQQVTGESREQILQGLSISVDQFLSAHEENEKDEEDDGDPGA
ncbi:hypothetical protein AB0M95_18375 [Sphaerisporangium sp. NPDC051017]|uniref:hypothetical protein n=1 Tax=Sphaerisporangium sp. NPDC051017 TaxID=3154636 RepID=UPI00342C5B94